MKNRFFIICTFFLLVTPLIFNGCGRKMDPLPPDVEPPAALENVTHEISENRVKLFWAKPDNSNLNKSGLSGFLVYRSKKKVSESECKGCPVAFKLASKSLTENYYVETLDSGYNYIFKIIVKTNNEMVSQDSNFVKFTY